jgi:hypothetical protein
MDCLTVSIGYGDYLRETLRRNRKHFDRYVVVTEASDYETIEVAQLHSAEIVFTEEHLKDGAAFNKGRAVNHGLQLLQDSGWVCLLDADIVLPLDFYKKFTALTPEDQQIRWASIYGIQRVMCESYRDWENYKLTGNALLLKPDPDGPRSSTSAPIGFCQIWNHKCQHNLYTIDRPTACLSDIDFAHKFPYHSHLDITCIHLSSIQWKTGTDWEGRKSPRFQ